ncbi:MAG: polysaccharide biosynthesis C-terminal domain-containing protein [Myxococcota bacterium]
MAEDRLQEQGLHRLVRFVGVSALISPAITLGVSVMISRSLGPGGRGAYGVIVTVVSVLPPLLGFGLDFAIRYWSARAGDNHLQVLKTASAIGLTVGGVGGSLILVCGALGSPDWLIPSGLGSGGVASYALIIFLSSLTGMWGNYLTGRERYGFSTFGRNFSMSLQLLALFACWLLTSVSLEVALMALLLQLGTSFVLFLYLEGKELIPALHSRLLPRVELKDMIRYGSWQYLSSMLLQANLRLGIFLLVAMQDLHQTGLYAAILGPIGMLWLLSSPLIRVLSARTTRRSDDPEFAQRVAGAMRLTLLITAAGGGVAAALAPIAVPMLFGDAFADAVEPLLVLIPGTVAFSVVHVVIQYLAGANRPKWNAMISAVGAGMTLVMGVWLIPLWGATGAAAAESIAYLASTAIATVAFLRVSELPARKLFVFQRSDFAPVARILGLGSA